MKKLLFLIMIVAIFSCKKEPECKTCRNFLTILKSNDPYRVCSPCDSGTFKTWVVCGKELNDADGKVTTGLVTIVNNEVQCIPTLNQENGMLGCVGTMTTICKSKWQTFNGKY